MRKWLVPLFLTIALAISQPSDVCAQSETHVMVTPDQLYGRPCPRCLQARA
jgi:hypothetical protein